MEEKSGNFSTKIEAICGAIENHRTWFEQQLGVPLSELVILEVDVDLTQIAIEGALGCGDLLPITSRTLRRMRTVVAATSVPPNVIPTLGVVTRAAKSDFLEFFDDAPPSPRPGLYWGGSPVLLKFHLGGLIFVALNIPYCPGPTASHELMARLVIARRDTTPDAIKMISHISRRDRQPRICVQDGPARKIAYTAWDDLVLDQSVLTLVKEDFENFFERRAWFRKHGFAFRRGYLLHGEPGTGKTSVVKAMLSSRGLTAYTLRFGDPHKDDSDLDRLFQDAVRDGPAAVLLEDIDRVFPASGEVKSNISLQQVLNSLDGIGTGDGIVVIGTANDPTRLDPAILRRPGRFDRVVQFAKPNAELRGRYIHKFGLAIDEQALVQPVAESDGFSFAFLREAIILAAQRSLVEGGDVSANDLLYAIRTLKQTMAQGSTHSKSVGLVLGKRPE